MSKISIEDGRKVNLIWGFTSRFLNNWFHMDNSRDNKDRFLSIELKGSYLRPALTPQNIDNVFNILRKHFANTKRKSVIF